MFVAEPLELDIENNGDRFAEVWAAATDAVSRRVPALAVFARAAVAHWRRLLKPASRALAGERRHRAAITRDLFRGHTWSGLKSDDDLPIFD